MNFRHKMYNETSIKKNKNKQYNLLELFIRVSQIIKCDSLKLIFDFQIHEMRKTTHFKS